MGAAASGVLILAGPTAVGKTEVALDLAERFEAEIVGADARQIYRDMPIGTAAPTEEQRRRIRHHLVGFLDPHEQYSAARFCRDALAAIRDIAVRGKRAIVAGGTGFYIRALCGDVRLAGAYDPELRNRLMREARVHPPEVLHAWLGVRDPVRASALAPGDRYRVVRALEIALAGGSSEEMRPPTLRESGIPFAKVFLDLDDATLEQRIRRRVGAMLSQGFVTEAEAVGAKAIAADAVGYPHALAYACGWCTDEELRALLVRTTRRYAKRQRTWFRGEPGVEWMSVTEGSWRAAQLARDALGWA
ncbi:MAG: tRNA (adenosine(37)-N6)-dimethylallyltransferase MiaA [Candidatus Eremiobacteraeota bacterium]|nr:tRNA (adenosine(37)-N6)-dimethylallyltransferase MiaA [Candidatus Eremiobacteraeota bacterium]